MTSDIEFKRSYKALSIAFILNEHLEKDEAENIKIVFIDFLLASVISMSLPIIQSTAIS